MFSRTYSNPHGQEFTRTSDTHGRMGRYEVEFETERELDVWLAQRAFVASDFSLKRGVGRPRKAA